MIEIFNSYIYQGQTVYVLGKGISDSGKVVIIYRPTTRKEQNDLARITLETVFAEGAKIVK